MAAHTTQTLFGSLATNPSSTTTLIDWTSSEFSGLSNPATATASQKMAALLNYWVNQTTWRDDKLKGIAPSTVQSSKQHITTRGSDAVLQVARSFNIMTYEADNNATFDPDNTI